MSLNLQIKFEPGVEEVAARVARFPERMMGRMVEVLDRENELTVGHIQSTRLSQRGPETLGVVTNRLRSAIRKSAATLSGSTVLSAIGGNVKYLGVHEYGFSGTVTVRAHERRFASVAGANGGRQFVSQRDAALLRRTKKKKSDVDFREGVSQVRSHSRKMEVKERAPIRRGIEERLPAYRQSMSEAILEEWRRE